jgi:putative thioredoxin
VSFVQDVTDEGFEKEVVLRSHQVPVVVDFWAAWCGPCRVLGPTLEKLANEAGGKFLLAKIDVDRNPRYAQAFGVRGIPAVLGFRNGKRVSEFTGALPEAAVREFLRKVLPSEADDLVARAEGEPERAESLYREALALDPGHAGAAVALAEILLARGETKDAGALAGSVPATGALGERAERLLSEIKLRENLPAASESELRRRIEQSGDPGPLLLDLGRLLAAEKRFEEALEILLQAAKRSRALAEGEAKEAMVEIFRVIGVRSPLADEYRTKLTRVLY